MSWHVGKDKDKVELSSEIIRKFDYDNEPNCQAVGGYIRKDVPKLAEWFEKDEKQRCKKQESSH